MNKGGVEGHRRTPRNADSEHSSKPTDVTNHRGETRLCAQSERDEWNQRRGERMSLFDDFLYRPEHLFEAKWDPIFLPEESRSMVSFFSNPERKNPHRASKSMLSGLLYCQLCRSVLTYSRPKNLGPVNEEYLGPKPKYAGQASSYKCSNSSLMCPGLGISAVQIEDYVVVVFRGVFSGSPGFKIGT